jgi:hypothetical protein
MKHEGLAEVASVAKFLRGPSADNNPSHLPRRERYPFTHAQAFVCVLSDAHGNEQFSMTLVKLFDDAAGQRYRVFTIERSASR